MEKSYYAQHQDLLKLIILEGQRVFPTLRLFSATNGLFFTKRGTPIKVGTPGQADLNGFVTILGFIPIHLEVEVKSQKIGIKKKSDQDHFRNMCNSLGVIHIVATSPEQFVSELQEKLNLILKKIAP